jgi:dTDP-4-amino-4,6-dideoxygalactose transaminase
VHTGFPNYPDGKVKPPYRNRPLSSESDGPVRIIRSGVYPTPTRGFGRRLANHFVAVLDADVDRDRFRESLADRGVQTSFHFPPLHLSPAYRSDQSLPLTEEFARRAVTLPLFPHMQGRQQELVIDAVQTATRVRRQDKIAL